MLVIQTAFIGDAILASAVCEKLHRFFPDAEIDLLVRSGNEQLYKDHPFLNQILVWNKKEKKYANLWKLLREIRKNSYDGVFNLQRFAASGFLTAFSGAIEKVGFDKNPLSFLFTKKVKHVIGTNEQPGKHEVERCLELIEHITDQSFEMPKLYPSVADFDFVKKFQNEKYVTISPASVWFTKQVPASEWRSLITGLKGVKIFLLGAPGDRELCEDLAKAKPEVINLAGQLSLLQSAALMKNAAMNYTGDSAPLHLCSAMNAPVTAIFCSTIPAFGFGPLSDNQLIVETKEILDCRPCGLHGYRACPKGHFKCSILNLDRVAEQFNANS